MGQEPVCFTRKIQPHTPRNHSIVPPGGLNLSSPLQVPDCVCGGQGRGGDKDTHNKVKMGQGVVPAIETC